MLRDWLPERGTVLEVASGTGEHAVYFAERFPQLEWQPSDVHPDALASIAAWREYRPLPNLREAIALDASAGAWPVERADAIVSIKMDSDSCDDARPTGKGGFDVVLNLNMIHISPWSAALGLIDGAARVLKPGGALILYGPWLQESVEAAPSNLAFDQQLRQRDRAWGLRSVEEFDAAASERGFTLGDTRDMPANNLMLLFKLVH